MHTVFVYEGTFNSVVHLHVVSPFGHWYLGRVNTILAQLECKQILDLHCLNLPLFANKNYTVKVMTAPQNSCHCGTCTAPISWAICE